MAVAVDQSDCPAGERKLNDRLILAGDQWIDPACRAMPHGALPSKKSKRVEQMDETFVNQQPRHLAKIRLADIRSGPATVGGAPKETELERLAEVSPVQTRFRGAIPRLSAPILVDQQPHTGGFTGRAHRLAIGQ